MSNQHKAEKCEGLRKKSGVTFKDLTPAQKIYLRSKWDALVEHKKASEDNRPPNECIDIAQKKFKGNKRQERDGHRPQIYVHTWINSHFEDPVVEVTDKNWKGPCHALAAFWPTILQKEDSIQEGAVCSHLCHNKQCVRLTHLIWESQSMNNKRNFCPGGDKCIHKFKCINQGPMCSGDESASLRLTAD